MNTENIIEQIYSRKPLRIALHLIFWLGLLGVQWWLTSISFNPLREVSGSAVIWLSFAGTLCLMLFYYPFVYFVLHRLLYKRKWVQGLMAGFVLVIIYAFCAGTLEEMILKNCSGCMEALKTSNNGYYNFMQKNIWNRMLSQVFSGGLLIGLFFSLCIPLSIKMAVNAFRAQIRSSKLSRENIELEFNFLKSQINPHFLFNSLNNIYGLILSDQKEKSARLVARLSEFMRYTLYDSTHDVVPVTKEVQLLKDYIELECIRLNHTKVTFSHNDDGSANRIASLLMIPIVENAFKYSSDNTEAFIDIRFDIKNKKLQFRIENSIDPDRQLKSSGGIGLKNFRKRLELYYPGRHNYTVKTNEDVYSASLNIDLI